MDFWIDNPKVLFHSKYIQEIFVTNVNPGGYWEDQGYNWFGGS
jgi:DMSO/TMAO reductase YedYZ molybdopterin-dependent catalytic subunit